MIKNVFRSATASDVVDELWPYESVSGVTGPAGVTYAVGEYIPLNLAGKFNMGWTGIHQPPAGTTYTVDYMVAPGVVLHGTDFAKAAFTAALRVAYTNQKLYSAYVYNPVDTRSTLGIYQSFPKVPFKNPGIVISTGSAQMDRTTLSGSDLLTEERVNGVPVSYYAWGTIPMQVNIGIVAITDTDRRKLTDITAFFIRHLFAYQLSKFGIGYKSVKIEGEKETEWQGQTLYMNNISIPVYMEFQVRYPIALIDVINKIELVDIQAEL
jgi:hypothetical protein